MKSMSVIPCSLALKTIEGTTPVSFLKLDPLEEPHINQLLADTLKVKPDITLPLAAVCFNKTQGNPFFLNQFLMMLTPIRHDFF